MHIAVVGNLGGERGYSAGLRLYRFLPGRGFAVTLAGPGKVLGQGSKDAILDWAASFDTDCCGFLRHSRQWWLVWVWPGCSTPEIGFQLRLFLLKVIGMMSSPLHISLKGCFGSCSAMAIYSKAGGPDKTLKMPGTLLWKGRFQMCQMLLTLPPRYAYQSRLKFCMSAVLVGKNWVCRRL